ncbi:histidinol dehydrogenase [Candidatus Nasuia deltocephalinicola]|uniref:histidinol dehydrogenase n=1 Tax=Candidatus Nasuia deltocephalincola TaxID=1160784 RepID=UPI00216AD4EF|nr:histidinol dehydrogenase [Candidatus Nasuia deltocephalinicola]
MLKINLTKIDTNNNNFYNNLKYLLNINFENILNKVENYVKNIIYNVKKYKEKSLLFYSKKFEKNSIKNIEDIIIKKNKLKEAFYKIDKETRFILEVCKNRIEMIHNEQKKNFINNWKIVEESGNFLGQKNNNIENVGVYIPGGKALYPSTVFMNVLPAKISNAKRIEIFFPKNDKNDIILASLYLCGVKKVFSIGGVQAIATMVYGNNIVKKVNKICGPGNIFVTFSKKILNGFVGIDTLAGPSEVVIFCDNYSNIENVVFDLFSQSEHDKLSQSILLSENFDFIKNIEKNIKKIIPFLYRKNINYNSILNNILLIKTKNKNESFNIINYISSEHFIINIKNDFEFFKNVKNSGSNFIGLYTSESFGDYIMGLNHVIPTKTNSKFSSSLGVYDFYKKISYLKMNKFSFEKFFHLTSNFSLEEKLFTHSESIKIRLKKFNNNIYND